MHDIQNALFQEVGLHTQIKAHVELSKKFQKKSIKKSDIEKWSNIESQQLFSSIKNAMLYLRHF
jgi:hypothetical protein